MKSFYDQDIFYYQGTKFIDRVEQLLVEQMKVGAGITEELKASDQMKWGGLINNVRSSAEEIVMRELIYV